MQSVWETGQWFKHRREQGGSIRTLMILLVVHGARTRYLCSGRRINQFGRWELGPLKWQILAFDTYTFTLFTFLNCTKKCTKTIHNMTQNNSINGLYINYSDSFLFSFLFFFKKKGKSCIAKLLTCYII